MSPFQLAAAPSRCVATSLTSGRNSILPSQQCWAKSHSESENPMAAAFSGLSGRFPRSTWYANADCRIPRNGVSPVRTWGGLY